MHTHAELAALSDDAYRHAYMDEHVRSLIAYQLRCIREKKGLNQKQFAQLLGKPQSVVSRLENVEYGKVTVQTLLDLSRKLDVSLIVKFVSFPEFLESYNDISPGKLAVESYAESRDKIGTPQTAEASSMVALPLSGPESYGPFSDGSAAIAYGYPAYYPAQIIVSDGVTAVSGLAVTPYVVALTTSPRDTDHV